MPMVIVLIERARRDRTYVRAGSQTAHPRVAICRPHWLGARFLPIRIEGGLDAPQFAIQVALLSVPSNPQMEGQTRWVGAPEAFWEGDEQTQQFGTYQATGTICSPLPVNFSASPEFWIIGEEIHHESICALRTGDATCVATLQSGGPEDCLLPPLFVMSGTCGDAVRLSTH